MAMTHDFYLVGVLKTLVDVRYLAKFWLTLPKKKFRFLLYFIIISATNFTFISCSAGPQLAEPAWLRDSQPRMATPLRLENFGRIDFSLGRWITRGKKTPKSMTPYAKVPGELVRIFFHSLLWPWESLF